jgi:1-deoxy-D-xylulose-5-phosphate synthase
MLYNILNRINKADDVKNLNKADLFNLNKELKDFIIENVEKTGGHLGSSLGCLELSVALCKVFDLNRDKIIWDIGHQSYAYKILSGKKDSFNTLRQKNGISGFTNPHENGYDYFIGGHSSVSISNAFGLKLALDYQNQINNSTDNSQVVAIIGDSAISSGVAFECLNDLGHSNTKLIVILNDNDMSISATTGALSKYLAKIKSSNSFNFVKNKFKYDIFNKIPKTAQNMISKVYNLDNNIFQSMGFEYFGVIDGHNLDDLIEMLMNLKDMNINKPILLHISTKKGNGYKIDTKSSDSYHGVESKYIVKNATKVSNTAIFGKTITDLAKVDNKIVAISASMTKGVGLDNFAITYPKRFFDVGIAEQHALSLSAGLAKGGLKVYTCIYSTFMQRAYDQLIHDVSLANLPIKFILDRAGLVGVDGETHCGIYDYSMFMPIANMVVIAPAYQEEIPLMLEFMNNYDKSPIMMRFNKESYEPNNSYFPKIELGKGYVVNKGAKIAILAIGEILQEAMIAIEKIKSQYNLDVSLINLRFAKPMDKNLVLEIAKTHENIITLEEGCGNIIGGKINEIILESNFSNKIKNIYIKEDVKIIQGTILEQKQACRIDSDSIYKEIVKLI